MRHVDDGALHAWLDGEMEVYPADEARWIREHLATCSACAERLEDARALREEAVAILSGDDVELENLPSLEELRAQARGSGAGHEPVVGGGGDAGPVRGSRGRRRSRQLAWAASIVLAAGAGWMANALLPPGGPSGLQYLPPPGLDAPAQRQPAEFRSVAFPDGEEEDGEASGAGASALEEGGEGVEPSAPSTSTENAELPTVGPSPDRARSVTPPEQEVVGLASEAALATEAEKLAAPVADTGVTLPAALVSELSDVVEARRSAPTEPEVEPAPEMERIVAQADVVAAVPEGVIPGLPVLSVEAVPAPGEGWWVRQRMESGVEVDVFLLPSSTPPSELPAPADGVNQWVERRGDGWRVLRGRLPVEVLQALAEGR
ncbi:MAG: zf-HC2 domain-containing protein [Gemmatimonadales bacterium]|nr:MAG: zf-HC2 domain-containing protein [Gemmatimonadales bacterium]